MFSVMDLQTAEHENFGPRQVAAVYFPDILTEVVTSDTRLFGVVMSQAPGQPTRADALLSAVTCEARRLGIRPGHSVSQARAMVAGFRVVTLDPAHVRQRLVAVADVALGVSPTVQVVGYDTVLVELTGCWQFQGGLRRVVGRLYDRVEQLGYAVRLAVANGPNIAAMLARYGAEACQIVTDEKCFEAVRGLPVEALALEPSQVVWLRCVGIDTIGALLQLPTSQLAGRLGARASRILDLARGHDPDPLTAYEPETSFCERACFDEPVETIGALVFPLQRLVQSLSKRLESRALALNAVQITLGLDRSIARLRGCTDEMQSMVNLSSSLWRSDQLMRVLRTRLEQMTLPAPVCELGLSSLGIVPCAKEQLDFSGGIAASHQEMAILLSELSSELGPHRVGTLQTRGSHCPERKSLLCPIEDISGETSWAATSLAAGIGQELTRLLPAPLEVHFTAVHSTALKSGQSMSVDGLGRMGIERVQFDSRIDGVYWWQGRGISRDYYYVWCTGARSEPMGRAWMYRDRDSGHVWLHGWYD